MEVKIMSTKSQFEEFKDSLIWKDLQHELGIWLEGFRVEKDNIVDDAQTSNASTAVVLMTLGELNGRKKAIQYMLSLPDIFIQILKEKENDSGREQADGSDGS